VTKPVDFRLLYVFLLGLSGAILLFGFIISTSVVEAVVASVAGLTITLLVAWRALPTWRGGDRAKAFVVGFGFVQLVVVIAVVAAVR